MFLLVAMQIERIDILMVLLFFAIHVLICPVDILIDRILITGFDDRISDTGVKDKCKIQRLKLIAHVFGDPLDQILDRFCFRAWSDSDEFVSSISSEEPLFR